MGAARAPLNICQSQLTLALPAPRLCAQGQSKTPPSPGSAQAQRPRCLPEGPRAGACCDARAERCCFSLALSPAWGYEVHGATSRHQVHQESSGEPQSLALFCCCTDAAQGIAEAAWIPKAAAASRDHGPAAAQS